MSFLDNVRNAFKEKLPEAWIPLTSKEQLEAIKNSREEKPAVIFKHSTSCGISSMAKFQLESGWDFTDELDFYYLDLWRYRPLSDAVSEIFGVTHQSPQMIIVKKGEVFYHTSHHGVHLQGLKSALVRNK